MNECIGGDFFQSELEVRPIAVSTGCAYSGDNFKISNAMAITALSCFKRL